MVEEHPHSHTEKRVFTAFDRWKGTGDLLKLSEFDRTLVLIWSLKGMIDNSGLDGFYETSTAQYRDQNIMALIRIGAHAAVRVLKLVHEVYQKWERAFQDPSTGLLDDNGQSIVLREDNLDRDKKYLRSLENDFDVATEDIWQLLDEYVAREIGGFDDDENRPDGPP
jgi:hypothetical protein